MNQSAFRFLCLWVALVLAPGAFAANRAVEININGNGPPVDAAALQTVRVVIGNALANGVIDHFNISGYAKEGGFAACAEVASSNTAGAGLSSFVRQLRTIHPNPTTTAYSVTPVASCPVDGVVCTQDVKQCPDGSFVSRIPPSCQFAACP